MRKLIDVILLISLLSFFSCKKDTQPPTTGTVTIDNTRTLGQTYYVYGFLFSEGKKVSTLNTPQPDITIDSDGTNLLLMANNLNNSFYKAGEFDDASSAKSSYDQLRSVTISESQWAGLASPLKAHQVWIYRSGTKHYAKFRIISTVSEIRNEKDYAECTFEYVYQPDGTLTFPAK